MSSEPAAGGQASACPRCGQPLIDPQGLGWCKGCGYCRQLGDEKSQPPAAAAPARAEPAAPAPAAPPAASGGALRHVYLIITAVNVITLAAGSYAVGRFVQLKPLERAAWTTLQIGIGLLLMFTGQFLAVLRLAPNHPTLTFKDCIIPFHITELILRNLPSTRWSLFLCSAGLTLAIAAAVFIGGLDSWFTLLPSNKK